MFAICVIFVALMSLPIAWVVIQALRSLNGGPL